jgi:hypothetical protein
MHQTGHRCQIIQIKKISSGSKDTRGSEFAITALWCFFGELAKKIGFSQYFHSF